MRSEEVHWRCPNRDCDWSFVEAAPGESAAAPECVCGRAMKRGDAVPAFHYLDFLREDSSSKEVIGLEKE
jgi:hypothetical protein